jgi:fatty acid desaturase
MLQRRYGQLFNFLFKLFSMKKNMGNTDRIIRLLLAAVVAVLYFTNTITGTLGIVLLILAGVFVLTSLISFCPLYTLVGLNTCPAKKK